MGCNNAGRGLATLFWNTYYVALLVLLLAQVMPGVSLAVRPRPGVSVGNNADADANADAVAAADAVQGDDPSPGKRSINYFAPESEYWLASKNHHELTTKGRKVEGVYPETAKTADKPVRGDLWTIKIVDCSNITLPAPPTVGGNRRKNNQTCSKVYIMNDVKTDQNIRHQISNIRYICMDRKGRVEMRSNATEECVFIEEHVTGGFYRYYSHHWYETLKKRESKKTGHCEKMMKKKCGQKRPKKNNKRRRQRNKFKEDACKWYIELTQTRKNTISTATRKGMCSQGREGAYFQRLDPNENYTHDESTIRSNIKTSTDPPTKIAGGPRKGKKGRGRDRKKGGRNSDSNGPRSPFSDVRQENRRRHNQRGSRTRTRTKSQPREDRKDGPLQRKAGVPRGSSKGLMSLSSSEWPAR